jgi:pSer/pThr/pTyr-binding forkhead associated (FHA) protein
MNRKVSIDEVMQACGATAPLYAAVEGPGGSPVFTKTFALPFILIGRSDNNDLVLRDPAVNSHHAYVQVIGGRLFCIDLESRHGTQWGGGPQFAGWLDTSQSLRIGPFLVRLSSGGLVAAAARDGDPLASRSAADDGLPDLVLSFFKGAKHVATGGISRRLTLMGNSRKCRVMLGDPQAAPYHCSLLRTPGGTWAIDLLSEKGGILLNGKRVRWGRLEDGDELQVAGVRVLVRLQAPSRERLASAESFTPRLAPDTSFEDASPTTLPGTGFPMMPMKPPATLTTVPRPGQAGMIEGSFPALPEGSDPVLVNLAYQFGSMQQQMFDQFQQTMMMMAQTFTTLHRDQQEMLRRELDRARELTREIQELQAELARRPTTGAKEPPATTPPSQVSQPERASSNAREVGKPDLRGKVPRPRSEAPKPKPAAPATERSPATANGQPDGNMHVLIYQRIQAMQKERESYWQRILQLLSGK